MFLTGERDTLSFVADVAVVAVVAVVAHVTFVIGINLSRELPEHGSKGQYCHAEHSEASRSPSRQILRFAQDDNPR